MSLRGICWCILLMGLCGVMSAQIPEATNLVIKSDTEEGQRCPDFAGTIEFTNFDGQSNSTVFPGPIYLCFQDQFLIDHNEDDSHCDADMTPFGIGYAFYKCQPSLTITGPSDFNIATDNCLEDNPPATNAPGWWTYRDQINGDAIFSNQGQIQDFFNGGDPEEMWFAPMTFDDWANRIAQESGGEVHVNTSEAFSVIYLNAVEILNKQTNVGGNLLAGSFDITGGVAEWDGTDYFDIGMFKKGNPSIRGIIENEDVSHNGTVNFTVPEQGTYIIYVEDEKSCGATCEIIVSDNTGSVEINVGSECDEPGQNECVSFCVEDFVDVGTMQFTIAFDPRILSYQSLVGINLLGLTESGSFNFSDIDKGIIRLTWFDITTLGQTLNDGDCMFDICFDILPAAQPGESSQISITGSPTEIEMTTSSGENLVLSGTALTSGELCILPPQNLTVYASTCNSAPGSFTGSISFEIYGGTGPYSYEIIGGFDDITGSGITEGQEVFIGNLAPNSNYIIQVTDAAGQMVDLTGLAITSSDPLIVDLTGVDPLCFNLTNGSVEATVSGGVPFGSGDPYTFEWSNQIFNTDVLTGLPQGNYGVTVTDANGCTAQANEYIGKDPINAQFTVNSLPTCEDSNNGDITVIATGGTPFPGNEYTFQWSSPNSLFEMSSVSQNTIVTSGLVNVRIQDQEGCQWEEQLVLGFEKELDAEIIFDSELACFGDADGVVRVNGLFQDGSTFISDNLNTMASPGTFGENADGVRGFNLEGGEYFVTLTDQATGCRIDTSFILEEPDTLIASVMADVDCASGGGGEVSISATGGTPTYSFMWDDGNTDMTRPGLAMGDYEVTVTDANGCTDSVSFSLADMASISIESFIVENIGCIGNTEGSITAVVNGSTNITYEWDGPGGPFGDVDMIGNLSIGTYYLTISDDMGCRDIDSVELLSGADFPVNITPTLPFCNGDANGILAANVPVTGNFTFEWDHPNNDNTELLQNIPAGTYLLSVTEEGGCTKDTLVMLENPPTFEFNLESVGMPLCSNSSDAEVTVSVMGGKVDNGNYGFLWSSGEEDVLSSNNSSTATMIAAGEQFVVAFDEECADTLFFTVDAPDSVTFDQALTQVENISCFGADDGSITLEGSGGTPGYLYFWPDDALDGPTITDLTPGFHRFVVADANNCVHLDSIFIVEPDSLILTIDSVNTINLGCSNDQDGVIFVETSGGNSDFPFTYTWINDISNSNSANGLGPGEYFITVTDVRGCTDSTSYIMNAPPPVSANIPAPAAPLCFGEQTCISIAEALGGSGPEYRFSINNGPLFPIDSCVNVFAGVYDIAVYDNSGCSFDTTLIIEQPEELVLNLGPDVEVDLGDSTTVIEIVLEGPNPIAEVIWDPNQDFDCLNDDCNRVVVYPNQNTLYQVSVTDINGCVAEDELLVSVNRAIRVYFPNAFSPNGDGFNDIFNLFTGRGIQSIDEFRVFDRWGNQMYQIMNLSPNSGGTEGWDGTYNGTDAAAGVYTYFAKVTLIDNDQVRVRGDVTLMR